MSLLSPDRYRAVLGARQVLLACRRAGRLENLGCLVWAGAERGDWVGAVAALEELLDARPRRRGGLEVVLGAHFVRLVLVPWSEAIGSPAELAAYARIRFEAFYGAEMADWRLCLSPEPAGAPRLAAALDGALLDRLAALAGAAGLRLAAVQPYLMGAFNRLCRPLAGDDFLFLLAEPERSCLLVARDGRWAAVRSQAGSDDDASLGVLLERESALQALEARPPAAIFVHAPGRADLALATVHDLPPQVLGAPPRGRQVLAPWTMAATVG